MGDIDIDIDIDDYVIGLYSKYFISFFIVFFNIMFVYFLHNLSQDLHDLQIK